MNAASPLTVAQACLWAYVDKDRAAMEALLSPDFRFMSPLDNGLDRATYFERCWPNSRNMDAVDFIHYAENGDQVFVVYEVRSAHKRFRNCELYTVRSGRLNAVEVYFGWELPHRAVPGAFVTPASGSADSAP